jgi:VanZ family protein
MRTARPPLALPAADQWLLPLFFGAHALVTGWLIQALGIQAPRYLAIPWIFLVAFCLSMIPAVRRHLTVGPVVWRLAPALLYAGVISLASSVSPTPTANISGKIFHPIIFAGLAFLGHLAAQDGSAPRPRWQRLAWVALACVAFGLADELHQSFVPGRFCRAADMGLDALGVAAGTLVYLATYALATRLPHRV